MKLTNDAQQLLAAIKADQFKPNHGLSFARFHSAASELLNLKLVKFTRNGWLVCA